MFAEEPGMRLGDWTSRDGGRGEDVQLAYLLLWREWPVGSQRAPAGVGGCNKAVHRAWG